MQEKNQNEPDCKTQIFAGLKQKYDILTIEPVTKGWSGDRKYYLKTSSGQELFLRVSDSETGRIKTEYELAYRMYNFGVPTAKPLETGNCGGGVYTLTEWLNGKDADSILPFLTDTEQYTLGLKAGDILRKIHSLCAPEGIADWQKRYSKVIDERVSAYRSKGIPFDGDSVILDYYERSRGLLSGRAQCLLHGDFHEGNLIAGDKLYVIDPLDEGFGNFGDPWYDFRSVGGTCFFTGAVRGYFDGEAPDEFWDVLDYYVITAALTSIVWMKYNKPDELAEALKLNERNAGLLRNGKSLSKERYLKDFYIQYIDGIPFKLKSPFDFSFLQKYGKVFKVFDDQDSGNICFGVENGGGRYFIKFAGAPTARAGIGAGEAVENLRRTVPVYLELAHPNLVKLISAEEIGGGFAMVFEWTDAECMHRMYPLSREKFLRIDTDTRLRVYDDILSFFSHTVKKGYVAIDFYDGSIMYDFGAGRTVICDIDFFEKTPYKNQMGRMWGSSRFMSPEEFTLGADIDEVTNVYTLGATAFALFGGERDRSAGEWKLNGELYSVAMRAVSDDRRDRQQSVKELIREWNAAK